MIKRRPSKLNEYRLAIGPNGNLSICVKGKPHIMYSVEAFQQLVSNGHITK